MGVPVASGPVWANGNVSADETPPPVKKSVRKAPIKKAHSIKKKTRQTKKKTQQNRAKKATPSPPRVSSLRQGINLMCQERYEAAYPWLQKAVQEERRNPEAWYWYGMYHEKTAQFEQAQFFYRKAMALAPGFEPFSRTVVYPGDGDRVPLWDPKRPARVYPIPTNDHGIAIIPPDAPQARRRPVRPPIDPELPKVPVYTPPEPGAGPFDGDAWQPSVYVPPGRERLLEGGEPVYTPPETRIVPLGPPPSGIGVLPSAAAERVVSPLPEPVPQAPAASSSGEWPQASPPAHAQGELPPPEGRNAISGAPGVTGANASPVPPGPSPQMPMNPDPAGDSAAFGNVPVYQPPLPDSRGTPAGLPSGDQPVYQPPLPPGMNK